MTPRKRPVCHSCGTPMAGHKRPQGAPICPVVNEPKNVPLPASAPPSASSTPVPSPLRREPSVIISKDWHYVNPHFREEPGPPIFVPMRPLDRTGTPNTWVSTEPADDIPVKHEPIPWDQIQQEPVDEGLLPAASPGPSSASSVSSSSNSSSLRRTFTDLLRNSRPVASLFSAPRDEVDAITHEARMNGLFTGLIHRPHPPPTSPHGVHSTSVKREDGVSSSSRRGSALGRASSWWLVLGQDAEAVGHLLDMQTRDTLRETDNGYQMQTRSLPLPATRSRMFDVVVGSMISVIVMIYVLSVI